MSVRSDTESLPMEAPGFVPGHRAYVIVSHIRFDTILRASLRDAGSQHAIGELLQNLQRKALGKRSELCAERPVPVNTKGGRAAERTGYDEDRGGPAEPFEFRSHDGGIAPFPVVEG